MAQYLDEQGLHYMVDKLNEKVTQISENEFENFATISLSPDCIYAVTETDQWRTCFNLKAINNGDITINIPSEIDTTRATKIAWTKSPWSVASQDSSVWNETAIDNTDQTITIPMQAGDRVYIKGQATAWGGSTISVYTNVQSTCDIIAAGNIKWLFFGYDAGYPEDSTHHIGTNGLKLFFADNTHLIDASNLMFDTVANNHTYYEIFAGCTNLIAGPKRLATTLNGYCYCGMFAGCTSLRVAPELPATTVYSNCYNRMFNDCISLLAAPELPATNVATQCYESMFAGCTSLTVAPELPVTGTMPTNCYCRMFAGCTQLLKSPVLPGTDLGTRCYYYMFAGCTQLREVTILAETWTSNSLSGWSSNVAPTGTFIKSPNVSATSFPAGVVPSGWTVIDYTA